MITDSQAYVSPSLFCLSSALNGAGVAVASISSVNELCDDLLDHTLECAICLQSLNSKCSEYRRIEQDIKVAGGAKQGMVFAV